MPYLDKPSNDEERLNLVKTTLKTNLSDSASDMSFLTTETVQSATAVSLTFENKLKNLNGALAVRSRDIREKNDSIKTVEVYIRDLWEVTKRRVHRKNLPAEVLTYYMLPLDGSVPLSISPMEIFTLTAQIIEGDSKAVIAGFEPAANPSAAELSTVLILAEKEAADVPPSDRKMSIAQEELAIERTKIDEVINDIIDDLEYALRKKNAPARRRIMRTYGVSFKYLPGEPEDPSANP